MPSRGPQAGPCQLRGAPAPLGLWPHHPGLCLRHHVAPPVSYEDTCHWIQGHPDNPERAHLETPNHTCKVRFPKKFPSMGSGVSMGTCLLGDTIQPTTHWACGFGGQAHPGEAPMPSHPTRGPRHAHGTQRWTLTPWLRDPFSTLIFGQGPQSSRRGGNGAGRGWAPVTRPPTVHACAWPSRLPRPGLRRQLHMGQVPARATLWSPCSPGHGHQHLMGSGSSDPERAVQCTGGETEEQQTPGHSRGSQPPDHCP